jgi:hypothetical protein
MVVLKFNESVTVKPNKVGGKPRVELRGGKFAEYDSGSGTDTLRFAIPGAPAEIAAVDLNAGTIIASQAGAAIRPILQSPSP